MKKTLVIGYCYPPTASPEAFVTAKLLRNIPDCQVDVLTLDDGLVSPAIDPEMGAYAAGITGRIYKLTPGPVARRLMALPRLPLRPDRWLVMTGQVVKKAEALIAAGDYDALVTRSQYHSAHLAGLRLKKRFPNLPWIACFSDPWSRADHQPDVPVFSSWSAGQEQKVLRAADRLVFPTPGLRDHMLNGYSGGQEKSAVIPHAWDETLYGPAKPEPTRFVLRLFGSFYHARKPDYLIDAIARVKVPSGMTLQAEIYGGDHPAWTSLQDRTDGRMSWKGNAAHKDALALMRGSDLLVVVDAVGAGDSFYLPSKIVDYVGSGQPVLSLCGPGMVADITREYGGQVVAGDRVDDIVTALENAMTGRGQPINEKARDPFAAGNVGAAFAAVLP